MDAERVFRDLVELEYRRPVIPSGWAGDYWWGSPASNTGDLVAEIDGVLSKAGYAPPQGPAGRLSGKHGGVDFVVPDPSLEICGNVLVNLDAYEGTVPLFLVQVHGRVANPATGGVFNRTYAPPGKERYSISGRDELLRVVRGILSWVV